MLFLGILFPVCISSAIVDRTKFVVTIIEDDDESEGKEENIKLFKDGKKRASME